MTVVTLDAVQTLAALKLAHQKEVRGGNVHDLLHAHAAELHRAEKIYSLDTHDLGRITRLKVVAP